MKTTVKLFPPRLLAVAVSALLGASAYAIDYPTKPITLVATFPAGGASDIVARTVAEPLGQKLGQAVVVDNRVGVGGSLGSNVVKTSSPEGYTLLLTNSSPMSIAPFVMEKQPYDPGKGFTHIFYIGATPLIVIANPKVGPSSIADLVKQAKAKTEGYPFGSGGPASIGHIVGEMFKSELKVNMIHVAYKGGAPMSTDLIGGQIPVAFDVMTAYVPLVKGGQLKGLAVTSAKRSDQLPEVPSIVEAGFPDLVAENYFGISGPPGMPKDVVEKLHKTLSEIVQLPATKKKLEETGVTLKVMTQAEYAAYVEKQAKDWLPAVKASGAKL
ncbi:MAG: transporter substrate-binding protein [Betaproteobacteria bacterium]|nr:transporter substrate-binding protein [Betaproteobacteria bacterium]